MNKLTQWEVTGMSVLLVYCPYKLMITVMIFKYIVFILIFWDYKVVVLLVMFSFLFFLRFCCVLCSGQLCAVHG